MEESQNGTRGKTADSTLSKQLIDAKIEIELLRKRVNEKTELLKDAATAITQHEEAQKRSDIENQAMIEQMQQYIYQLEVGKMSQTPSEFFIFNNLKQFFVLFSLMPSKWQLRTPWLIYRLRNSTV